MISIPSVRFTMHAKTSSLISDQDKAADLLNAVVRQRGDRAYFWCFGRSVKMREEFLRQDMEKVNSVDFIDWSRLKDKTILITGATGLIGFTVVNALLYANKVRGLDLTVLALVRSESRARERFADVIDDKSLKFVVGSVEKLPEIDCGIDFIIHGASQTASKMMVEQPVETILTSVMGTKDLLDLAKEKNVEGMVYLSSMEMYGHPERGHKITEDEAGALSPLNIRNSYPISKVQSEALCCAYASEYGVPVMIARLAQTFGPGVNYNDTRVFAYFGRCVAEKKDIVLKTRGETERCYLYTADAATAIIAVMLNGQSGDAYNLADESTYCSIAEMAQRIAKKGGINVRFEIQDAAANGFPDAVYMNLDTSKLKALGWKTIGVDIFE